MRKIIIIGPGGSGKSTLARTMGEILRIPVHHLDRLQWHPHWVPTPEDEWKKIQEDICSGQDWIIDGNYGGTMDIRLSACDTIVFLDFPRWLCIYRAIKRFLIYRNKSRPDMTEGCPERINREFFQWIWEYPKTKRPGILEKIDALKPEKGVFILASPPEVIKFIETLKRAKELKRLPA